MHKLNFQTIILAGGFGKRSGLAYSKTLINTGNGTTILENILTDLNSCGIEEVTMVTNSLHFAGISDALEKIQPKTKVNLIQNGIRKPEKALGALGDLLFTYHKIKPAKNTNFLVLPCDTTYWNEFSVNDFLNFVKSKKDAFATMACDVESLKIIKGRFGCLEIDNQKNLVSFEEKPEKPKSTFRAVPIYFYRTKDVNLLEKFKREGGKLDSPGFFVPYLLEKKIKVVVFVTGKNIIDAGVADDIKRANRY